MAVLLRTFLDIALMRLGPEDLPASRFLLGLMFAIAVLVNIPLTWIIFSADGAVVPMLVIDIGLMVVCLWLLLQFCGLAARFVQTLTALLGTSTLLKLATLPFVYWNATIPPDLAKPPLPTAVILAILLWSFAIDGHILARAMSRPFMLGLLLAIGYFFLHTMIIAEYTPLTG